MHPRVAALPSPSPDFQRLLTVLRRATPDRVPAIELAIHPEVVAAVLDEPGLAALTDTALAPHLVRACHALGYDGVKVSAPLGFQLQRVATHDPSALSSSRREWADEHAGPIGVARRL
jgi:hypothetical protein